MKVQVNFCTERDTVALEAESFQSAIVKLIADDFDLSGANLRGANLRGVNLRGANLYGANLYGANLSGANLSGADLYGADLYGADLYGADLYGANLSGANLSGANLSGANLRGANLRGANLYGAKYGERVLWSVRPILLLGPCGSRNDMTIVYFFDDKSEPIIHCGCFTGAIKEFAAQVKKTHGDGFFAVEYLAMIAHIKGIRKIQLQGETK